MPPDLQLVSYELDVVCMPAVQAATGAGPPGGGSGPPREGDGFTFEHLAEKKELWIDFCADTGDGGCVAHLPFWLCPQRGFLCSVKKKVARFRWVVHRSKCGPCQSAFEAEQGRRFQLRAERGILCFRDPTYTVARAMAAPVLHAKDSSASAARSSGGKLAATADEGTQEDLDTPRSTFSDSSSGLDTPTECNRSEPLPVCLV